MTRRSTEITSNNESVAGAASSAVYVVIPGDLETRTGGYGYDRRIIAGLRDRGWAMNLVHLDDSFPAPTAGARAHAAQALASIPAGSAVLIDGLALGAMPDEVEREAGRLTIVALVHHPLAAETGIDPARAAALETSERRALAATRAVVVTSRATARALADYTTPKQYGGGRVAEKYARGAISRPHDRSSSPAAPQRGRWRSTA